jgi:ArsR family transcriptional regulator, lead/cadmium/zinc/bismuth-responsive transcriptional repressor
MARPRRIEQINDPLVPLCEDTVIHIDSVRTARAGLPPAGAIAGMSELFAAIADPTRLRIISALATEELCVCDLAATIGQSESAVSHQLRVLRLKGLVRVRRAGRLAYYALDDEHVVMLYRQAVDHIAHTSAS